MTIHHGRVPLARHSRARLAGKRNPEFYPGGIDDKRRASPEWNDRNRSVGVIHNAAFVEIRRNSAVVIAEAKIQIDPNFLLINRNPNSTSIDPGRCRIAVIFCVCEVFAGRIRSANRGIRPEDHSAVCGIHVWTYRTIPTANSGPIPMAPIWFLVVTSTRTRSPTLSDSGTRFVSLPY